MLGQLQMYAQALMAFRLGTTQLWILGCLLAWVFIVWIITRIIQRPTPEDDAQQAREVSRPATLEDGAKHLREIRKVRAGSVHGFESSKP